MARWFRSHAGKLNNPKVQRLSDKLYRAWDSLLCVACEFGGILPPLADTAFLLRKSEEQTQALVDELTARGFFVKTERGIEPNDWNEWQYQSDVSTERVKRFRERQRNVSVTPSESEADTDTEADTEKRKGAPAPSPTAEAVEVFNAMASEHDWPRVQVLNPTRKRGLELCLRAVGGIEGWQTLLAKVIASDFLMGRTRRSEDHEHWRFDFDFLVKPKRYIKLMEGGYDNTSGNHKPKSGLDHALAELGRAGAG